MQPLPSMQLLLATGDAKSLMWCNSCGGISRRNTNLKKYKTVSEATKPPPPPQLPARGESPAAGRDMMMQSGTNSTCYFRSRSRFAPALFPFFFLYPPYRVYVPAFFAFLAERSGNRSSQWDRHCGGIDVLVISPPR